MSGFLLSAERSSKIHYNEHRVNAHAQCTIGENDSQAYSRNKSQCWQQTSFHCQGAPKTKHLTSFSSTSTLMKMTFLKSSALESSTNFGPILWQGPHHVAVKSTATCGKGRVLLGSEANPCTRNRCIDAGIRFIAGTLHDSSPAFRPQSSTSRPTPPW